MKNLILLAMLFSSFSCTAQYPLKTDYTEIPNNSYVKDLNNELPSFVGIYKANYQNNIITLNLNLENHKFINGVLNNYYIDLIKIEFRIESSNGLIFYDTQNQNIPQNELKHTIRSMWVEENGSKLLLYYGGTNCGVGWGQIELTKSNSNQLSWKYEPNSTIIDDTTCPTGTDINIYLPVTQGLVFTKQ